jgi:hypothetical protein
MSRPQEIDYSIGLLKKREAIGRVRMLSRNLEKKFADAVG